MHDGAGGVPGLDHILEGELDLLRLVLRNDRRVQCLEHALAEGAVQVQEQLHIHLQGIGWSAGNAFLMMVSTPGMIT
jgi:hypothetical protein